MSSVNNRRWFLKALLVLVAFFCTWLMSVLLSFDPADPSWSQTAWNESIHNLGGVPGAWLADMLFFIFGVTAYAIPIIIMSWYWFSWIYQQNSSYTDYFIVSLRFVGATILILSSCCLLSDNARGIWYFSSGGIIGNLLNAKLRSLLQGNIKIFALLCTWTVGFMLFMGFFWFTITKKIENMILNRFSKNRVNLNRAKTNEVAIKINNTHKKNHICRNNNCSYGYDSD